MKKNILARTNGLVCLVVVAGFLLTALLSYKANYTASLQSIEQVSKLTSEGIYYQMSTTFTKPVNISLTMANDSLLHTVLAQEHEQLYNAEYTARIGEYLRTYQERYGYDAVFLVSAATNRYYNFNGLDRVLSPENEEDSWYFDDLLASDAEYTTNVDNDEVVGADNAITIFVNCKIFDNAGALLGVVGVGVRIDGLQRTLQAYREQFDINAYLIDGEGNIELSMDYSGYEHVNLFALSAQRGIDARREILDWKEDGVALSFWSRDRAGRQRDYVVARYLPEVQWHLVVERNTDAMIGELSRQFLMTVLVIVGIVTVILVIITHVIRRFNQQIVHLTQAMEQERRTVFATATEQLFDNIYEVDVTNNVAANRTTAAYFENMGAPSGCSYEDVLGVIAEKQIQAEFREGYLETFSPRNVLRAYAEGKESLIYELRMTKDGTQYDWMRITARLVRWETDNTIHMLVYRQNIDAEKCQERRMLALAQTDEMTGLLTKTATRRQIASRLTENPGATFAYFIFDIDNFKQANDLYGHAFGDTVICAFVQRIRGHFRKSDVIGRIGGDEFVVFAQGTDMDWVERKAQSVSQALCFTHTEADQRWQVSASIGVARSPAHGTDVDTLYRNADAALYQTKAKGKNGYTIFTS